METRTPFYGDIGKGQRWCQVKFRLIREDRDFLVDQARQAAEPLPGWQHGSIGANGTGAGPL